MSEQIEDLQNGYYIIQNHDYFCFGKDAVLLADFAKVKKGETVIDFGCGNGIIPILLCAKYKNNGMTVVGLEIQEHNVDLAKRSVEMNSLGDRIDIKHGDIRNVAGTFKAESFDVVVTNPPYMNVGGGRANETDAKSIARHEIMCSITDIARATSRLLKFKGRLYMVHRPGRLVDIVTVFREFGLEVKMLQFVHGGVDKEPKMVLVEALKGGSPMCKVLPPMVL